ncbi:sensor histidine kinase [Streptomyces niveiscabiei]|uniref:sensor histidine kinase n=1 Tax=Streptomyces niveiscabiei TaxID=164115 RepID=UPI0038F6A378
MIAIGPSDHTASVFGGGVVERVCAVVWFVAIAGRRFAPGWALWAGAGATVAAAVSGAEVTNVSLASALALALVVRSRPPRRALELAGVPVAGVLLALASDDRAFVPAAVAHGVAWLAGRAGRARDEVTEALRARDGERAVTAERARMARELHDAVGHAVTVMLTHAGAARLTLADGSPPVREALTRIEEVGRAAMTDLDRILGLLTESYDVAADIHNLTDRLPADVPAQLRLPPDGELRGLPAPVAEAVGRVVQESLTNVVRHARPARVVVEVGVGEGRVVVRVTDDGGGGEGVETEGGCGLDARAGGGGEVSGGRGLDARAGGGSEASGGVGPDAGARGGAGAGRGAGPDARVRGGAGASGSAGPGAGTRSGAGASRGAAPDAGTHKGPELSRSTGPDAGAHGDAEASRDAVAGRGARATRRRAGGGRGLRAMRERVAGLGGWVEAGVMEGGRGWRVMAVVPVPTESQRTAPAPPARGHPVGLDADREDGPRLDAGREGKTRLDKPSPRLPPRLPSPSPPPSPSPSPSPPRDTPNSPSEKGIQ